MTLAPGSRLGPYTIVDRLGAGGMGEVYRAKAVSAAPSPIFETPFTYPLPGSRRTAAGWRTRMTRRARSTFMSSAGRCRRNGSAYPRTEAAWRAGRVTGASCSMAGGSPGKPALLLDRRAVSRWSDYDVAPDGRFLAIVPESIGEQEPLTVVVNWRSRVP